MQYLLLSAFLFWKFCYGIAIRQDPDIYWNIQKDLMELNATCEKTDGCNNRNGDSLTEYGCNCGPYCAQLGTCCLNSSFTTILQPKLKPVCRTISNRFSIFVVNRCPSSDSVWERPCRDEWNNENDVLKMVPVTSLFTTITYKNYYCFRCHEASDDFIYWNIVIENNNNSKIGIVKYDSISNDAKKSLKYDTNQKTWMVSIGKPVATQIPVNLTMVIPDGIWSMTNDCEPDVISTCSEEWTDREVRDKCQAYMATRSVRRDDELIHYRNIHCALCNFENLNDITCKIPLGRSGDGAKAPFSFTHLLDINQSDGDEVGKIKKCENDQVWDPYGEKCRKLACALPGHKLENGKCVKE